MVAARHARAGVVLRAVVGGVGAREWGRVGSVGVG